MDFTDRELEILSDALLRLIGDAGKAKALVTSPAAHKVIDNEITVLRYLNTKICNYMEG